jgi:hypothetical protein
VDLSCLSKADIPLEFDGCNVSLLLPFWTVFREGSMVTPTIDTVVVSTAVRVGVTLLAAASAGNWALAHVLSVTVTLALIAAEWVRYILFGMDSKVADFDSGR